MNAVVLKCGVAYFLFLDKQKRKISTGIAPHPSHKPVRSGLATATVSDRCLKRRPNTRQKTRCVPTRQQTVALGVLFKSSFSKLPTRQQTVLPGLANPTCFSKLPTRQQTTPKASARPPPISKLPTRQQTHSQAFCCACAFSKLPTRQQTGCSALAHGLLFSKLPTRQQTSPRPFWW